MLRRRRASGQGQPSAHGHVVTWCAITLMVALMAMVAALTLTDSTGTVQGSARGRLRRILARTLPGRSYTMIMLTFLLGRPPRPRAPTTVIDLISRTLLGGATSLQRRTADKVAVARWVDEQIGPGWIPHRYAVVGSFDEIGIDLLPDSFVVKASHGSGMTAFVRPAGTSIPVRDDRAVVLGAPLGTGDAQHLRECCERWLAIDYGQTSHEPQYRGLPRQLLVEEDLCVGGDELVEVSFFCVRGTIVCARIRTTQASEHLVDSAFRLLMVGTYHRTTPPGPPPLSEASFEALADAATTLAAPFDFVRVDLCEVGGRLLFSELTHTPQAGKLWFRPHSFTNVFGRFWRGDASIPARFYPSSDTDDRLSAPARGPDTVVAPPSTQGASDDRRACSLERQTR